MARLQVKSRSKGAHPRHPGPHAVRFYEHDESLVEELGGFVGGALEAGGAAVVMATPAHRRDLENLLRGRGLDPELSEGLGRLVFRDAAEVLEEITVDGRPDEARFTDFVGSLVAAAGDDRRRQVRAFGEMGALLWAEGRTEAALRLEDLWTALGLKLPFSLLCAYPLAGFGRDGDDGELLRVSKKHSLIIPAESYSSLSTEDDRMLVIAELQRKAHALEAEIRQRKESEEALRAADRAKDEFLAMLSHELRNPLSAVRNAVLTAKVDPSLRDRALEIASRGAEQLRRLVDDLLDVARITRGRIELRKQRLPFAVIVERAVEITRPLLDERAHGITVSVPGSDVTVDGDATRLEQVIVNLITNAAKYTKPGGHVGVTAIREGAEVVLRIRDSGIGMTPEMLARVFDLFAQADRALDRVQGGLGIGLTIVKRLVELHGGRVEARSEGLGKGAEFTVRLPAVVVPRAETAAAARESAEHPSARILLVEDNEDSAESLRMLLEVLGHGVRVVHDGPAALEALRRSVPDVMLVDIGLPGMDGYEVARRIGQDLGLHSLLLVALTGTDGTKIATARSRPASTTIW